MNKFTCAGKHSNDEELCAPFLKRILHVFHYHCAVTLALVFLFQEEALNGNGVASLIGMVAELDILGNDEILTAHFETCA